MKECAKIKRMLSRYIDKEASNSDIKRIEAHLGLCASCKNELSSLARVKGLIAGVERKVLPQNYLAARVREKALDMRYTQRKLSLAGMGSFARRLIPVPIAVIVASIAFIIVVSAQTANKYSFEDHVFSGNPATAETALKLILGTQNYIEEVD